jgi:hypothetical protein
VITLDTALTTARHTLAAVARHAQHGGYYTGDRTAIINSHAELCAALDMLIKAAEHAQISAGANAGARPEAPGPAEGPR